MTLKNKKVLVTGGSGSLGRVLIRELLKHPLKMVVSLSRDEGLIKEAEQEISSKKVHFELGDICDVKRIEKLIIGVDFVYHAAALKHVSMAEKFPREVLKINILGLLNMLESAKDVSRFIYISSDKAIGPTNCYGSSKLFAEYLVRESNNYNRGKYFSIRCPNFLGSRGSVIDLWKKQISKDNTITITDPNMTRYFISLPDASRYIVDTSLKSKVNLAQSFYPQKKVKKFKLEDLAKAFIEVFGDKNTKIKIIGAFPGEKRYEDYLCEAKLSSINELKKILANL